MRKYSMCLVFVPIFLPHVHKIYGHVKPKVLNGKIGCRWKTEILEIRCWNKGGWKKVALFEPVR
jgi:hypothetical protein